MLNPQQKRMVLSQYFFFNEFLERRRDKESFIEFLDQFSSSLVGDGFSQEEIEEIKNRVRRLVLIDKTPVPIEKIIPLITVSPSGRDRGQYVQDFLYEPWKKDVDTFVRQAREYLRYTMQNNTHPYKRQKFLDSPYTAELSDVDLVFLCNVLGLQKVAFLYDHNRHHYMFLTQVESPSDSLTSRIWQLIRGMGFIRAYDPLDGKIHKKFLQELVAEELTNIASRAILSSDFDAEYYRSRKKGYTPTLFLRDIHYRVNEGFVKRIGAIQMNIYDCGPLVVYAAVQSKH